MKCVFFLKKNLPFKKCRTLRIMFIAGGSRIPWPMCKYFNTQFMCSAAILNRTQLHCSLQTDIRTGARGRAASPHLPLAEPGRLQPSGEAMDKRGARSGAARRPSLRQQRLLLATAEGDQGDEVETISRKSTQT